MSEAETEKGPSLPPEEMVNKGEWEVEPFYYYRGSRELRGKVYRSRATTDLECFEGYDGIIYRIGTNVYVEAVPNDAYLIGTINSFKLTKRDVVLTMTRYYRPEDVPEVSLSVIAQARQEGGECTANPREIFSSDDQCTHSLALLRGLCTIHQITDFVESRNLDLAPEDSFFSCVLYNQESTRLASHNGQIKVGASHQAKLPPEATTSVAEEPDRDELLWRPGQINKEMEEKYVNLARTFRLVLLEQGNIHEAERNYRGRDMLLDDAITTLHRCNYSYVDALKEMNANDQLLSTDANFMTVEDTKKFGKGIKTLGKNFTRISRELLPLHSRDQLVAFYYLWKKSPDSFKPKAMNNRSKASNGLRRGKKENHSKNSRPPSREFIDYASASENEFEGFDENKRSQYACHHCFGTESKDWHHAGKDTPLLLCTECRVYYKKYGQMRNVEKPATVPSCIFKRSNSDTDKEEEAGVRTRAAKKENGRKRSPSYGEGEGSVNGDDEKNDKKQKRLSNGKRKKSIGEKNGKRRKDDAIKEEEEVDDDKKSSTIGSPSPLNDIEMKKDEDEEKEKETDEKMENGVIEENGESEVKKEEDEASTMNGEGEEGEGKDDDEDDGEPSEESETAVECNQLVHQWECSTILRVFRRGNNNSCSRSDLIFTATPENVARRKAITIAAKEEAEKKKLEEAEKNKPAVVHSHSQAGPSSSTIAHPLARMPVMQSIPSNGQDASAFLQHMTRQPMMAFNGTPQFPFDPRIPFVNAQMTQAMMEQRNQQHAAQVQNQREMEELMKKQGMQFMNGVTGGAQLNPFMLQMAGIPPQAMMMMQQQQNGAAAAAAIARQQQQQQSPMNILEAQRNQLSQMLGIPMAPAPHPPPPPPLNLTDEGIRKIQNDMLMALNSGHPLPPTAAAQRETNEALRKLIDGKNGPQISTLYHQLLGVNGMTQGNHAGQLNLLNRLYQDGSNH